MSNLLHFFLAILCGVLFSLSWPEIGSITPLIFVAFVPIFYVESLFTEKEKTYKWYHFWLFFYTPFLVFNVLTTWWIYLASFFGMVSAVLCNALFSAILFWLFHKTKVRIGKRRAYIAFIFYWLGFEYLHMQWQLSWPWLTLGNVFSITPSWIQWYELTGVLGGSLWVLLANIFIYEIINGIIKKNNNVFRWVALGVLFLIPFSISYYLYTHNDDTGQPIEVIVVQPNIDPYVDKFGNLTSEEQVQIMLNQAEAKITPLTKYIVFPETAIPNGIWEHELLDDPSVQAFADFVKKHPKVTLVTGLSTFKHYLPGETLSETARKFRGGDGYYDAYNTAMMLDSSLIPQLYRKSKLVPGVEKMPYPTIFGFLEDFAIDLGGISGSLGSEKNPKPFKTNEHTITTAICYESVYGDFLSQFIRKGSDLLFVITNDGWWGNTPGYRQHLHLSRLRAIEFRRNIARSANTGISAFIDQRGNITQQSQWWLEDALVGKIYANNEITFYAKYGDYLGRICGWLSFLMLAYVVAKALNKTQQRIG